MICNKCGKEIPEGSTFCSYCEETVQPSAEKTITDETDVPVTEAPSETVPSAQESPAAPKTDATPKANKPVPYKKKILRFVGATCAVAAAASFALFFYLLDALNDPTASYVAVGIMAVEFIAACALLIAGFKKSETVSDNTASKPLNKVLAIVVCIAQVLMLCAPFIYIRISSSVESGKIAQALCGYTYVATDSESKTEYTLTFAEGNKCTLTAKDMSGYTHSVTSEEEFTYKVEYSDSDDHVIHIGNDRCLLDRDYSTVRSFTHDRYYSKADPEAKDEKESKLSYRDLRESYNEAVIVSSKSSAPSFTNSQAITAATHYLTTNIPSLSAWSGMPSSYVLASDEYGRVLVSLTFEYFGEFSVCIRMADGDSYYGITWFPDGEAYGLSYMKSQCGFGVDPNAEINKALCLSDFENGEDADWAGTKIGVKVTDPKDAISLTCYIIDLNTIAVKIAIDKDAMSERTDKAEDMNKVVSTITDTFTGKVLTDDDIALVFKGESGVVTDKPVFLHDGYILHAANTDTHYIYTVTNGWTMGYTEDNYVTPLSSTTADSSEPEVTEPEETEPEVTEPEETEPEETEHAPTTNTSGNGNSNNGGNSSNGGNGDTTPKPTECSHKFTDATCDSPKTCSLCGETSGSALGHKYSAATCTSPEICTGCGETGDSALGHKYSDATCLTPATCETCGNVKGDVAGHLWEDATCTEPDKCLVCGKISGEPNGHTIVVSKCKNCDHVDFSMLAKTFTQVDVYVDGYYSATDDVDIIIDSSGVLTFMFREKTYSLTIAQTHTDKYAHASDTHFDGYINGSKETDVSITVFYNSQGYRLELDWNYLDGINLSLGTWIK